MQQTSATWKQLWAAEAPLEARALIGGVVFEDISAPVIHRAAMQGTLSIGNVAAASLSLVLRGAGYIPRSAAVVVEARLNDGETASEWLPQGTFYISRRARDPVTGLLALECYDALLKANAPWTPSAGAWPRTMAAVVTELAGLLGLSLDSRTVVPSGGAFMVSEPQAGTTIRDALGSIAQAGCGNWIVTPENRLRLVALDEDGSALDVAGAVGGMDVGTTDIVTGVRCSVDGSVTLTGDDTGIVVDVTVAPVIAVEVADRLIGLRYQPFDISGAIFDPAAELADAVNAGAGGEIASVLWTERLALGPAVRGDISAPEPGELADEYPYIGSAQKTLTLAKAAVAQAVDRLDDSLTQQEIFNRLTDSGAAQGLVLYNGQLYINASYIQSGTLKLGGVNNVNGTLVVQDAQGNQVISLSNDGFSFKLSSNRFGLYIDGSGSIALGEKPDNLNVLDDKAFIQLMSGGIAKVANLYFGTRTLGIQGMIGPMDDGGLFLCGPDGASEYIAMLSTDEARILSENTRLDGDLRVVGQTRLNNPLDSFYGGTGVSLALPPSLLVNLGSNSADNVFQQSPRPGVTGTLGLANGGTNASNAADARTNLDVPSRSGSGASGTWGISVTGNAATATKATQDGSGNNIGNTYLKMNTAGGIASCSGGGSNWYFRIATVKITDAYINRPIVFEISGRGRELSWVQLIFKSYSGTDPALESFTTNNWPDFWVKKTATSTWEVYGKYNELYGTAVLHRLTGCGADIGVTVDMVNIGTAEPSGATKAVYSGNVSYANNSGNVTGTVAVDHGGTGATTKAGARTGIGIRYKDVTIAVGANEVITDIASSSYDVISLLHINPVNSVCNLKGAQPVNGLWYVFSDAVQTGAATVRVLYVDK